MLKRRFRIHCENTFSLPNIMRSEYIYNENDRYNYQYLTVDIQFYYNLCLNNSLKFIYFCFTDGLNSESERIIYIVKNENVKK